MKIRHIAVGAALLAGVAGIAPATAGAASEKQVVSLTCGSTTVQVATNGNGEFTPAHAVGSTSVYVPVSFGDSVVTLRDPQGNIVDQFTDPGPRNKGNSASVQKGLVDCTYTGGGVSDGSDPNGPPAGYTFTFTGTVTGFQTPRGK